MFLPDTMPAPVVNKIRPLKEPSQFPPCKTLDALMHKYNISNSFMAHLCFLAHMELEVRRFQNSGLRHPAATRDCGQFLDAAIFLKPKTLDMTHLSKFRNGHQLPWRRARIIICYVMGKILRTDFTESDLFPELQIVEEYGDLWSLRVQTE